MNLKKILIILIILLVLIAGTLIAYNLFLKEKPESDSEPTVALTTTTESYTAGEIKAISQEPVIGPAIDNKTVKYYLASNGNVYKSDLDGTDKTRISSAILPNLIKILWSPDRNKVIAVFEENGLLKKYSYDYSTGISTLLNRKIRWLSWSPTQNKIAYQYYDSQTEDNNIAIANPDGSQWTNVLQTRMKNLIVEWPASQLISIRTKPSGLAQSVIYTINLIDGDFKKILNETYGFTVLWSPLGNKFLFSETDAQGKNLKLKMADLDKQTTKELDIVTLPEKCVWSKDNRTIFCAAPKSIPAHITLPDDYYKGIISFSDDFWQFNLDTQEKTQILKEENEEALAYDAKELLLSPLEDYLLFVNKKDGLLYSLGL